MREKTKEGASPLPRKCVEGPFGTPHGGVVGRIWRTSGEMEIQVFNLKVVAGLLQEEAPVTCEAFLSLLPYEGEVLSLRWSGDGFQTHHPRLDRMAEDYELCMENYTVLAARGDILFWVRDRGLFFCYNYMYSRGVTGEEPANLFAHVKPEHYPVLYEMGKRVHREGKSRITIRRLG